MLDACYGEHATQSQKWEDVAGHEIDRIQRNTTSDMHNIHPRTTSLKTRKTRRPPRAGEAGGRDGRGVGTRPTAVQP
eukprot:1996947-Prymnesium_polylepis.1